MSVETFLLKKFISLFKELKDLEHWSIEGLEIIPRSLIIKKIKEYERILEL